MIYLHGRRYRAVYFHYLPKAVRLCPDNGQYLLSDNVLQDGGIVIESRFAVERRNRRSTVECVKYL